jgi:hypothetical protein
MSSFQINTIVQTVCENVSKAWSYGRCDASLSRGFAAPYVASYVNSFVALPDFYTQRPKVVRPKSFQSIGFTESNLCPRKVRITEIDEVADKCLDGVRVERDGYFRTIKPTWPYLLIIGILQSLIKINKTIVVVTIPKINYFIGDDT